MRRPADPFALNPLIEWLERQNPNREYDFHDVHGCLLHRYFTQAGFENVVVGGTTVDLDAALDLELPPAFQDVAHGLPRTYAGALERAREAASV